MKDFLKKYWAIICIIVIWFTFSSPFFLKGRVPFPSDYLVSFFPPWSAEYGMPVKNNAMPDIITQIYPWKMITIDSWKMGQIPLWNPYSFSGTPHAANYQTAVFSPINLLFFVFPRVTAWSILILVQPLLASLGMYLFLTTLRLPRASRFFGSVSYMFCGFLVAWMGYGTLGFAALWLPYILAGITEYIRTYQVRWAIVIAGFVALSFLSGHFQISVYVLAGTVAYIIVESRRTKSYAAGGMTLLYTFIGLGLAAPQLLLSLDAYLSSVRSASFVRGEVIPWQYLITFFSPDFYGNPVTRNDWFGHYAEWMGFVGTMPLLLACYGVFQRGSPRGRFFAGLAVATLLFALPTPLQTALFALKIPVLSTSAASRVIMLTSLSVSILAAFGLDKLRNDWSEHTKKAFIAFAAVALVSGGVLWLGILVFRFLPQDKLVIAQRNTILPTGILLVGIIGSAAGFWKKKYRLAVLLVILLVTSGEMLRFAAKWMPFSEQKYVYPPIESLSYLSGTAGEYRVFGNFGGETSVAGIKSIEGYDALYQKRYGSLLMSASDGTLKDPERSVALLGKKARYAQRVLDILGVKYILHRISDGRNVWAYPWWEYPQYASVYKDEHYEILKNRAVLPRYYLASDYRVVHSDAESISMLLSDDFEASSSVILEEEPSVRPEVGESKVTAVKVKPNEMLFDVSSTTPKILTISDTFDPGWRATVDGVATKLYRANYDFRAIPVPSGNHTVRMWYWPNSLTIGMYASGTSLIALIVLSYLHRPVGLRLKVREKKMV